ncbi:MAG: TetR/AcrR family transcriptional regulator [Bifidobacteriaceae bacterium]|jgi:AcrR family transcriptional regulator|nr:TetR/AcrR family transcriptional regulator [Bifidobacteriaceae bacterium]MCI1914268.1 TetR/AcrR family transcriptional regulator [Bifidobacteriaceae bacterium]
MTQTTHQTSGGVSRRYAKGEARRQEIIRIAMEVFAAVGYNKSSMLEISQKSGLTRAGLAHYFPTKESLLTAVLKWRDSEDHKNFISTRDGSDPQGFFQGLLRLTAHNATIPGLIALYAILSAEASAPEHPAHDYFVHRYEHTVAMMETNLRAAADQGKLLKSLDPHAFAVRIVAVMDGLQIQWLLNPGHFDMVEHLRALLSEALTF